MTTGLERIAIKSRNDNSMTFTSLAHHITPELLWDCLNNMSRNSSEGIDAMSVKAAIDTFNEWSGPLINSIHQQGYQAPPVRRVFIPKPGKSEKRPIGIPTVIDRTLQGAVSRVLSAIYEQDFINNSTGGRRHRSALNAVATLERTISSRKVSWVYEADLKNFFGSLDHEWAIRFLSHRVGDPRILSLVRRWLKAGVMENGQVQTMQEGTPQGGPVSVLLSNLYLHYALDLWFDKVVKPRLTGEVYYIRYIDDFVLCFQHRDDAIRFEKVLVKRLARFSLTLEPDKTRLVEFGRFAIRNSQARQRKPETLYFLGFTFYCSVNRNGRFKVGMKTEKSRLKRSHMKLKLLLRKIRHFPLAEQHQSINRFLTGHYNYYGVAGNYPALKKLYYFAVTYWRRTLSSRSQRGNVTWEKYTQLLKYFPVRKPKVRYSYSRLTEMALW